jgi:hypothetical protein
MATLIRKYSNFGDNTLPVLSNDSFKNISKVSTDFIFQPTNALGYSSGSLPANGASVGTIINLSRDVAPLLSRTGAVTALPFDAGNQATFDTSKGAVFAPTTKQPLSISKVNVASNVICSPNFEGFIDFMIGCWFRVTAYPASQAGIFACGYSGGKDWGVLLNNIGAGGGLREMTSNSQINSGAISLNTLYHVAVLYRFNVVANTTTITLYLNGVVFSSGIVGQVPTAYATATGNRKCFIGGANGYVNLTGSVSRVTRDYVGLSSFTDAQVLDIVKQEYASGISAGI